VPGLGDLARHSVMRAGRRQLVIVDGVKVER
jgi:hypothetical protein